MIEIEIEKDKKILEELGFLNSNLIGIGVFGRVYKAETKNSKDAICLKVIPSKYFKKEEYEILLKLKGKAENLIIYNNIYEPPGNTKYGIYEWR
jgi:uncharacterized protein YjbK